MHMFVQVTKGNNTVTALIYKYARNFLIYLFIQKTDRQFERNES